MEDKHKPYPELECAKAMSRVEGELKFLSSRELPASTDNLAVANALESIKEARELFMDHLQRIQDLDEGEEETAFDRRCAVFRAEQKLLDEVEENCPEGYDYY